MKKSLKFFALFAIVFLSSASYAWAHATVKPSEVGVGSFQTFSIGVPNEKQIATTQVRLVVPESLEHVMPSVKPGWKIQIKEKAHDESMEHEAGESTHGSASEVTWSGGSIPVGQRDDFTFSAKAPVVVGDLVWKIYQTYADGTVVAWDLAPGEPQPQKDGKSDFSTKGPASVTKVLDDVSKKSEDKQVVMPKPEKDRLAPTALALSCIAVIASAVAIAKK